MLFIKKLILIALLAGVSINVSAQFTKSIPLKPIYKNGQKYFYGTKRVNSGYSLQIPLEGIDDPEVNRYYNGYKTLQNLRGYAYLPAMVFLFAGSTGSQNEAETFLYLLLAGVAGDITFNLVSHHKMGKAIDIYNVAITERASLGLQLERTNRNQTLISLGIRKLF
jgi:hypothetical protein